MRALFLPWWVLAVARSGEEAQPAPSPEPPAVAVPEVAPESADRRIEGEIELQRVIQLLSDGQYEAVLAAAIPAMSRWPSLAPSFRAAFEVAADQLERRRLGYRESRPTRQRRASREWREDVVDWGFDIGLPSGLRFEWKVGGRVLDSFGFRVGGNFVAYDGVHMISDSAVVFDVPIRGPWQLEGLVGFIGYYGWLYPQTGAALQYDPPSPLLLNVGARVGPESSVVPELSAGFVW
jgi:hypothetical protein